VFQEYILEDQKTPNLHQLKKIRMSMKIKYNLAEQNLFDSIELNQHTYENDDMFQLVILETAI